MAIPSVQGILAMLDPYKGFSTAASAQAGIAAGNVAADSRSKRAALAQQKALALADDARAGQYLQLQQAGQAFNQKQDLNDRRMKAYAGFQAAVDSGDTEGADLAANQLRMLGVDVQQYGGEKQASQAPEAAAPSPVPTSPTDAVAQAQAKRPTPMSTQDAKTSQELDALKRDATVDSGSDDPMGALGPAPRVRPRPSSGGIQGASAPIDMLQDPMSRVVPIGTAPIDLRPLRERLTPIPNHVGGAPDLGRAISDLGHGRSSELSASESAVPVRTPGKASPGSYEAAMEAAGKMGTPTSWAEQVGPDQWEARGGDENGNPIQETGPRPAPAREMYIKGQEPAEAGKATPQQSLVRGYRLKFDGQVIDIDPQSVQERQRQRVASALRPLFDNARTVEEENAARTAIQAAMASVGTLKPNEAIEYGLGLYKDPLDRGAKEKRARIVSGKGAGDGFGGVGDLSESKKKRLDVLNDDIRTYVQGFETKFDVTNLRKSLDNGNKVAGLLGSKNSVGQRAALTSTLKAWFGSASSNTELKFVLESSGKWASLENQYNAWVNGGELSDDFVRNLKEAIAVTNDFARRKLHETGEQAAQGLLNDFTFTGRMTPEEAQAAADNIRGRFTGVYRTEKKKGPAPIQRGSKAPGKAPPASGGGANERARRLLGK